MRALLPLAAASLLAVPSAVGQTPVRILRGQVTDSLLEPIPAAEVAIIGTGLRGQADSLGLFRIEGVPIGVHPIVARAIGWKPLFFMIEMKDIADGQELIVRIGLERAATRLPEIVVKGGRIAKPPEYAFTTRYDGFFQRRLIRSGTFRTRADAVFRTAFHTVDLLKAIPTVTVRYVLGQPAVEFGGCQEGYSKIGVWIDGARVAGNDHNAALGYVRPNDIELIEVYRRSVQIPVEFLEDSCAAIVIWTR
jgi:hypothetical protein